MFLQWLISKNKRVKLIDRFFSILDVILRSIWIEQLPNVVQYLQNQNLLDDNLNTDIAIIISNLMQFTTYQVRKIASSVLVILVERNFIDTG